MVAKIPPPPFLTGALYQLNRWLIEIQNILNAGGLIDPSQVEGLPAVEAQVTQSASDILTLQTQVFSLLAAVASLVVQVATLNGQVSTINGQITTINGQIVTLQANGVVRFGAGIPANGLGNVGDWYADTSGSHVYVKTGAITWQLVV